MKTTIIVILIIVIIIAWTFFQPKDPRKRIQTKPMNSTFEKSDMEQKYSILINKILESPIAKLTSVTKNKVIISATMPNTYTEYKITESDKEVMVDWYANLGPNGTKTKTFRYNIGKPQIEIFEDISNYMIALSRR